MQEMPWFFSSSMENLTPCSDKLFSFYLIRLFTFFVPGLSLHERSEKLRPKDKKKEVVVTFLLPRVDCQLFIHRRIYFRAVRKKKKEGLINGAFLCLKLGTDIKKMKGYSLIKVGVNQPTDSKVLQS